MTETLNIKKINEKVYAIMPVFDDKDISDRIDELKNLVLSAGAEFVGCGMQKIREITPSTLFGKGKLEEMKIEAEENETTTIVCDYSLSPAQQRNLSDFFDKKVIDKTALILDIFALNARTNEGKLQVEVAQLEYLLPRLKGQGKSLSRLGGGIGTRGPGETQLETDRRHILSRIKNLKNQLDELNERRDLQNDRRDKNNVLTVALAGYTNVGKSSILNLIAKSDVLAENRLFATLDPTARKVKLGNIEVVFFDTVGFIRDIPTDLIEAFKSTLSCVKNADLMLNVCDLTSDFISQTEVTEKILKDINATSPVIKVYNKCDNISDFTFCDKNGIVVSAKTGEGIENLKKAVEKFFEDYFTDLVFEIKYTDQSEIFKLKKYTEKFETEYFDDHIKVNIRIKKINLSKFAMFLK